MTVKGITLIELLLVILIMAILASLGYSGFKKWNYKQKIERDTRIIYAEIQSIRRKSFTEKKTCGLYWSESPFNSLEIRCDNDSDRNILHGYDLIGNIKLSTRFNGNVTYGRNYLRFSKEGLAMEWGSIYSAETEVNPEYNCIIIHVTRIEIGHWNEIENKCEPR